MSDLVGNPEDRFSQNEAHLKIFTTHSIIDSVRGILIVLLILNNGGENLTALLSVYYCYLFRERVLRKKNKQLPSQ